MGLLGLRLGLASLTTTKAQRGTKDLACLGLGQGEGLSQGQEV